MSWPVRELAEWDRGAYQRHLLQLDAEDRRLRFGTWIADSVLRAHVARIDFGRDALFAVFDDELKMLGAAHLAQADGHAELGVSVLRESRNRGIGGALLMRAALRARNWGVAALFMHCLRENGTMMHLARKKGMRIVTRQSEADAWLKLLPADASTHFGEVLAQRVALFDYALKSQLAGARRLVAGLRFTDRPGS